MTLQLFSLAIPLCCFGRQLNRSNAFITAINHQRPIFGYAEPASEVEEEEEEEEEQVGIAQSLSNSLC